MNDLPRPIQQKINRYEPVETDGIALYPIRVEEYEDFLLAKPALEFLQQSLPVALMSVPILQAYYAMDIESVFDEQAPTGLLGSTLLLLALALRLGEGEEPEKRIRRFRIVPYPNDTRRLRLIAFSLDGEEIHTMTPAMFQRWKPIIAAQNGVELLPDDANPELVQAEKEVLKKHSLNLDTNMESLVCGVAALSGAEEAEIYSWPILKLQNRQNAIKQAMDYIICGVGESQGTKWKLGNPCPHPFFDRVREGSLGTIGLDSYLGGAGAEAVRSQEAKEQ